ncbi:hypothetical protein NPX13_g11350 [Xylaria arbuscula]|uniref:Rhodopsin domain-containing protein n=1 Tax=Xylaria arbuscula TaxID=114810 RepID=A0A9W8N329_9PEZI|nr:hypothetical protein NPX13_g11350 [Xylaria arbuscula]
MATPVEGSPFSAEQLQYWIDHESDSTVVNIIVCASITGFLSTVFVAVRLFGRWRINGGFKLHISDWLIAVAWVFFVACVVSFALLTPYGGGRHVIYISNTYRLQVFSIITEGTYAVALGFIKFSMLTLYGSVFPDREFHRYLWALGVFITGWTLTSSLGAILQCVPIEKAYNGQLPGYCIHYGILSLVVGILNVLTDFTIAAMPIPLIMKLNMGSDKKRVIILTFAAGSAAVIVSLVRLVYSLRVGTIDGSWTAIPAGLVSTVEVTVGFFVVSIPVYRKLYRLYSKGTLEDSMAWSYKSDNRPLHSKSSFPTTSKGSSNSKVGYKGRVVTNIQGAGSTQEMALLSTQNSKDDTQSGNTVTIKSSTLNNTDTPSQQGTGVTVTEDVDLVRLMNQNGKWVKIGS